MMKLLRRMAVMASWGALGALVAALPAERFFHAPLETIRTDRPQTVCLLFDVSGSMKEATPEGGTQLGALQAAAETFLAGSDAEHDRLALVAFASRAVALARPGDDRETLAGAIDALRAGGTTNLAAGLETAGELLRGVEGDRWILLFSDGKPQTHGLEDAIGRALTEAAHRREEGVRIVAIGTGLADAALLEKITGDPDAVLQSDFAGLPRAFQSSQEIIRGGQMLATGAASVDLVTGVRQAASWASVIALGISLALVVGQNRYLRRRMLGPVQALVVLLGSVATGLAAGSAGQGLYFLVSRFPEVEGAGRMAAWILLGGGIGWGLGHFVPNLRRDRALVAGAVGGIATAAAFLTIVPRVGDSPSRLAAAALLGLFCGLVVVLVEAVGRRAWLVVRWGNDEESTLLLGDTPIVIGKSARAHVCPSWEEEGAPVQGTVQRRRDGVWFRDERAGGRERRVRDGDVLRFGRVSILVREARTGAQGSAPESREPRQRPGPGRRVA